MTQQVLQETLLAWLDAMTALFIDIHGMDDLPAPSSTPTSTLFVLEGTSDHLAHLWQLTKQLELDKNLAAAHPRFAELEVAPLIREYDNPDQEMVDVAQQIERLVSLRVAGEKADGEVTGRAVRRDFCLIPPGAVV